VALIKSLGAEQDVPVFFVMNRYKLGKAILRKVAISCVGVMNYQGSEVSYCSNATATFSHRKMPK
jgi:ribosomal protein L7Ae-like RNA K-turn-binding protein